MRTETLLMIAGAVAAASASDAAAHKKRQDFPDPVPPPTLRSLFPNLPPVATACTSVMQELQPVLTQAPTPNPRIMSLLVSDTSFRSAFSANPCEPPEVTGAVGQDLSSYISAASSFQDAHSDELRSLERACGTTGGAPAGGVPQCTPGASNSNNNNNNGSDGDNDGENNSDSNNNNNNNNGGNGNDVLDNVAAPRETGMVVAAAAAMVGVIVAGMY